VDGVAAASAAARIGNTRAAITSAPSGNEENVAARRTIGDGARGGV
jgi:hypothetical protein